MIFPSVIYSLLKIERHTYLKKIKKIKKHNSNMNGSNNVQNIVQVEKNQQPAFDTNVDHRCIPI